jgi:tetratricopeptide (TPR) repeat protein
LVVRRAGDPEPVLEVMLPLDVDHVATAADAGVAAVVAAIALSGPGAPDRAGAAYELWLRARHVTQLDMPSISSAIDMLEDAARLAPDDARIIATLAMVHVRRAFFASLDPTIVQRASQLARAALAKGPDVAEAHLAAGQLEFNIGDPVAAAGHFRLAIARAPHLAEGHEYLGRMLLEANFRELAHARLHEAIAIAPHLIGPRWEMAHALALAGRWDDYDHVVARLAGDTVVTRAVSRVRYAIWRGDRAAVERIREHDAGVSFAPDLLARIIDVYLAPETWPQHRDATLAIALDPRPLNRRRRAFMSQLTAEAAARVGDADVAVRCINYAVDNGLFDLAWLNQRPDIAAIAALPACADARAVVQQRAEAILDALYGDHELRTIAETRIAT